MMTKQEAALLKVGQNVRALVGGLGHVFTTDDAEEELAFAPGEIVEVCEINTYPAPQGLAITVAARNGVVNVFDESDYGGEFPFERQ